MPTIFQWAIGIPACESSELSLKRRIWDIRAFVSFTDLLYSFIIRPSLMGYSEFYPAAKELPAWNAGREMLSRPGETGGLSAARLAKGIEVRNLPTFDTSTPRV
ncbi:hypothetical protein [Sphingobium sp.]|uniref:hypothetical protein n=1 Tax=Sphingobium sp. TaxID=1912891 RepID=UPI003BB5E9BD